MRGSHIEPPRVRSGLFLEHSSPLTDPSPEACLSAGSMVSWADGTETSGARLHGWVACTVRSAQASRRRVPAELDLATSVAAEVGDHHQQVIDGHSGTRQRYQRVGTRPGTPAHIKTATYRPLPDAFLLTLSLTPTFSAALSRLLDVDGRFRRGSESSHGMAGRRL